MPAGSIGKEKAVSFLQAPFAEIMQLVGFAIPDEDDGEPAAALTTAAAGAGYRGRSGGFHGCITFYTGTGKLCEGTRLTYRTIIMHIKETIFLRPSLLFRSYPKINSSPIRTMGAPRSRSVPCQIVVASSDLIIQVILIVHIGIYRSGIWNSLAISAISCNLLLTR